MFKYHVFALLLGTILDFVFGRIYGLWDPFDSVDRFIAYLDRALFGDEIILVEPSRQKNLGMWLIFLVLLPVFVLVLFFLMLCYDISPVIGVLFEAYASYLCISGNYLFFSAKGVMDGFYGDGISSMKDAASTFIGQTIDTDDEAVITSKTITFLSRETSDSVISPIFVMFFFGPVGGFVYRSICMIRNRMEHSENRYRYFSYYINRLYDIVDYIPGYFSGTLTVFAAGHTFGGFNGRNARYIHLRDKSKSVSAFAGAIGITLDEGKVGDADKKCEASDIRMAIALVRNDFLILQCLLLILLLFF